jgi:hypothetical protein
VFGSHEKITKCKNQSLTNVAGIRQCPVAVAGFRQKSLTGSGHIRPDPSHFGQIRPESSGSIAGSVQIRPAWPETGKFRLEFGHPVAGFRHRYNSGDLIPAPAGFRRPDVLKLRRRLDSDDRMLSDSDADRISTTDNC